MSVFRRRRRDPERRGGWLRESLRATREALAPVGGRRVVAAGAVVMGLSVAGLLLFAAASFWWTSQPSFCARCHVMTPYVEKWEASPHREVNCERCHLTPGFFGFIGGKIAGLQVVMNYIRGTYEDWSFNAAVPNAACLQCHEDILAGNVHDPRTGITVSHRNIVELGGKCLNCHSTVAHGEAVAYGSATHPTMSACLRCHNDRIAPLECNLCHTGRQGPPGGDGGGRGTG
ncbi:MAG TPA: NapC/NirT family cytochrome c [Actinomycetota bacterium]|nr:NapC/NirT family cytochrome c [Actinomycetota bacterium]